MPSDIIVFLPTYNESENLPALVERLFSLGLNLSILIVDDQSPDGTGQIADRLAQSHAGRIRVIHREGPRGRGLAGVVGLREASRTDARWVVEMDADLSHDPDELPRLLAEANDADLVIGSRNLPGGGAENFGWMRQLNSAVARFLTRFFLGLNYTDPTSGYRVYRREALAPLPWDRMISPGPSIVEETLFHLQRNGARIKEAPIVYRERRSGRSKITPIIILRWIQAMRKIKKTVDSGR